MRTIEEVIAELRKDIHSDVYLGKKTINTYLDEILEIHKAERLQGDLISRSALKKAISDAVYNFVQLPIPVDKVQEIIDNAPTVEYTFEEAFQKTVCEQKLYCPKRPHGEWVIDGHHYKCSRCGKTLAIMFSETDDADLIGCPFCLADMQGCRE